MELLAALGVFLRNNRCSQRPGKIFRLLQCLLLLLIVMGLAYLNYAEKSWTPYQNHNQQYIHKASQYKLTRTAVQMGFGQYISISPQVERNTAIRIGVVFCSTLAKETVAMVSDTLPTNSECQTL